MLDVACTHEILLHMGWKLVPPLNPNLCEAVGFVVVTLFAIIGFCYVATAVIDKADMR